MSSVPEYFYTVELPEKHGKILERLAHSTAGLFTPEEMAARLLCDALEAVKLDEEYPEPRELTEEERRGVEAARRPGPAPGPDLLEDGIPF